MSHSATETIGAPAAASLTYEGGDGRPLVHGLAEGRLVAVGRNPSCDLALAWDDRVSRTHAVVERLGSEWTVSDDGLSRNGTYVNGDRVAARRRLVDGDVIRVGNTLLRFRHHVKAGAGSTRTGGDAEVRAVTPAQRKVLVALCRPILATPDRFVTPASNAQIAEELILTVEAIKSHLRALFERFAVEGLPQTQKRMKLAEIAVRTGIVTERDL